MGKWEDRCRDVWQRESDLQQDLEDVQSTLQQVRDAAVKREQELAAEKAARVQAEDERKQWYEAHGTVTAEKVRLLAELAEVKAHVERENLDRGEPAGTTYIATIERLQAELAAVKADHAVVVENLQGTLKQTMAEHDANLQRQEEFLAYHEATANELRRLRKRVDEAQDYLRRRLTLDGSERNLMVAILAEEPPE